MDFVPTLDQNQASFPVPTIRLAVVGDSGVGKSLILRKLCYSKPDPGFFFDFGANIEVCYHLYTPPTHLTLNHSVDPQHAHDSTDKAINSSLLPPHHTSVHQISQPPKTDQSTANAASRPDQPTQRLFMVEFIDLPGHKRYKETRDTLLNEIDGVILFFDARHARSEKSVRNWYNELVTLQQQRSCFTTTFVNQHDSASTRPHQPLSQANSLNLDQTNQNDQTSTLNPAPFPLFLVGTVINSLPPFHFGWIDHLPFHDLVYIDTTSIEEFVYDQDQNDLNDSNIAENKTNNLLPPTRRVYEEILNDSDSHPFLIFEALVGLYIDSIIDAKVSLASREATELLFDQSDGGEDDFAFHYL